MNRLLADAALPPELLALDFIERHILLILGIIALVAAVTVVLIVLLKKRKRRK